MAAGLTAEQLRGLATFLDQLDEAPTGWRVGASSFLASAGEDDDEVLVQVMWDEEGKCYRVAVQVNAATRGRPG